MSVFDWILYRLGLVRRNRYDHLYECYRDVFRWWEKRVREE